MSLSREHEVVLRVLAQPNPANEDAPEWRGGQVVHHAAALGTALHYDTVRSMCETLVRRDLATSRREHGAVWYRPTPKVLDEAA